MVNQGTVKCLSGTFPYLKNERPGHYHSPSEVIFNSVMNIKSVLKILSSTWA